MPLCFFLVTCGIPNYFYLGSSYVDSSYKLVSQEGFDTYDCEVKINDSEQVAKCKGCPSLLLFYTLDSGNYIATDNEYYNLYKNFANMYNTVSVKGGLVSLKSGEFNQLIEKFSPANNTSLSLSMYNFASSTRKIERPSYHISVPIDNNLNPTDEIIKFRISFNKETKELLLLSDWQGEGEGAGYTKQEPLLRSNGTPFSQIPNANSSTEFNSLLKDNLDYSGVNYDDFQSARLHIFAALCASSGNFDNIYWSNMFRVADPISLF